MATPADLLHGYLALLVLERLVELAVSARNLRALAAAGGVEHGRGHHPLMVAFHLAFLGACVLEPWLDPRPWPMAGALAALGVALLAQALRWWAVATLGPRWTTRVVVLPGTAPVTAGPYRLLRHPNYLAVVLELAAVPLIGGALATAVVASALNALLLLVVRIPTEERALGPAWREAFGSRRGGGGGR